MGNSVKKRNHGQWSVLHRYFPNLQTTLIKNVYIEPEAVNINATTHN